MKAILSLFIYFVVLMPCITYAENEDGGKDLPQIYHLYDYVDMITTERYYTEQNPKISVKAVYPQLEGNEDDEAIASFNDLTRKFIKKEMAAFRAKIKEMQPYRNNPNEEPSRRSNLFIDYNSSAIKASGDHLISVRFTMQGFIASMAHPYHYHRVITFNLDTGEQLELADLFAPNTDYLTVLSTIARNSLSKHLANKNMVEEGTLPTLNNFKNWNLKPDGLLITFDEYQVAPYVNGAQTVLIPYPDLKAIVEPDSVIAECTEYPTRCRRGKLLTGGFIDEAVNTRHRSFNPTLG